MPISKENKAGVVSEKNASTTLQWINSDKPLRVRVEWATIESTQGTYNWSSLDNRLNGIDTSFLWIQTHGAPLWARPWWKPECWWPQSWYWDEYAQYLIALNNRYHPQVIGNWNEPGISAAQWPNLLGCMGTPNGENGFYHGQFCKAIYDAVKPYIGDTLISVGNVSSITSQFVINMMSTIGTSYDVLGFHNYPQSYPNNLIHTCQADWNYAKSIVASGKGVSLCETAVTWKGSTESQYEQHQIQHYQWLMNFDKITFWYTLANNGWPEAMPTDMVDGGNPRPVYSYYN